MESSTYIDNENGKSILEAESVYLLMKKDVPISRSTRLLWLIEHLNKVVQLTKRDINTITPTDPIVSDNDLELLSCVPAEPIPIDWNAETNYLYQYRITDQTKVWFLAYRYKLSICLDMSPSQSIVDIQRGMLLLDQMIDSFTHTLYQIAEPLTIPGSCLVIKPYLYVTIIAHTPFFTTPAQQVLVKGVCLSKSNVHIIADNILKQLRILIEKISEVTTLAHEQIEAQQYENDQLMGTLFDEDATIKSPNIPMVSPDASFINMLRYSMLALSLLPNISLASILVITDGVVCMPDINILESLLQQLHFDSTSVSFLMIGSSYHPHCNFGYVPYRDILHFISTATLGFYLENHYNDNDDSIELSSNSMCHKRILLWTYNNLALYNSQNIDSQSIDGEWTISNISFHETRVPILLKKKQVEDKLNASLIIVLSRRLREGYTLDKINYENNRLEIVLSLPWKTNTYLLYTLITQWPSHPSLVNFQVSIKAPYESLHDTTCPIKKHLRSAYRQAVVERFWSAIGQLTTADTPMAKHLNLFNTSNIWYLLPESVRSGMPVFTILNTQLSNIPIESSKLLFAANDNAFPRFSSIWQQICQLETTNWRKWFHIHRISIILHHDQPLPAHLHLANSSGRFTVIQCRQAVAALYGTLSEFASFVLIDNQAYVKFLYQSNEKYPRWFCIIRITSKLPCPVLNIAFVTDTPGVIRNQVCDDLKNKLRQLTYSVRANAALQQDTNDKSPSKSKESVCCTIVVKPLEKILIRYERMPNDLTTVVFPDGTQPTFEPVGTLNNSVRRHSVSLHSQPSTPRQSTSITQTPVPTTAALLTTLSRYLHHRRWVWGVSYPSNPQLSHAAVARILSTITKMRLNEGFSFAHCSSGIINMVLEVEMSSPNIENDDENLSRCIIQYVMFPPHNVVCKKIDFDFVSDSDDDTTDYDNEPVEELQMVTEVWIEPQFGFVTNCPPERNYLQGKPYHRIADVIGNIDSKCISSLLTVEHLSLMCHQRRQFQFSTTSAPLNTTTTSGAATSKNMYFIDANTLFQTTNSCMFLKDDGDVALPLAEERIHKKIFAFNLTNILPKCRQAKLLFATFEEQIKFNNCKDYNMKTPNQLLLNAMYIQLKQLNDHVLDLKPSDSQMFLELVLKRDQNNADNVNHCKWLNDNYYIKKLTNIPLWRCYIKGVSDKHVLLTFIPASLNDLIQLKYPSFDNEIDTPVETDINNCLILPIFIYDCSLKILINSFIDETEYLERNLKDIYEDRTSKQIITDLSSLNDFDSKLRDNDKFEDKLSLQRACRMLLLAHSNCFVTCTFKSLHQNFNVASADVEAAVQLCENTVISIDITKYLKTVCGHIKYKSVDSYLTIPRLLQSNICYDLRYFHTMIKEKFRKKVIEYFHPVPSNAYIYYHSPVIKRRKNDSESENWSDFSTSEGSPLSLHCTDMYAKLRDVDNLLADNDTPLFLNFKCSVNGIGSVPICVLPTCLQNVFRNLTNTNCDTIKLSELFITLDIVCSTLPIFGCNVDCLTDDSDNPTFDSTNSSLHRFNSENSIHSEFLSVDNMDPPNVYSNHKSPAIAALEEEIKWQLRDEIVTALLDIEPVTEETLNIVTNHVFEMVDNDQRTSGQLDLVTLNFVYGPSESLDRFLQEFNKLPVPDYKLIQEGDYYFLSKDYPTISTLDISTSKQQQRIRGGKQYKLDDKKKILPEVQDLMLDILNEVESDANDNSESDIKIADEDFECDPNSDHDWLSKFDKRRNILPNFWMIMKVNEDVITVYFHCRFLELHKTQVNAYLAVHRSVISAIKSLCKHVNQFLLLQSLHDTRTCDALLEAEETNANCNWFQSISQAIINQYHLKSVDDSNTTDTGEFHAKAPHVEAALKYIPGFFACSVVWETHFTLHPRLKTSNNVRPGLPRGIQALRTVLNKFSVVNRNNMFVYRDNCNNVFYLRLHENPNMSSSSYNALRSIRSSSSTEDNLGLVARSPSIASLPVGSTPNSKQNLISNLSGNSSGNNGLIGDNNNLNADIRPRVRSFGEKESQEAAANGSLLPNTPPDDTITLKVHGITGAGRDVTNELVQVLQNRLDDAVLELLSIMLERNPMCKLTPEDVHFLQKPFKLPDNIIKFSIQKHTANNLESLEYYLEQNLLQFLHIPKYTNTASNTHFRDYVEPDHIKKDEKHIFLYNQSTSSGNRGIACIAFNIKNDLNQSILSTNNARFQLEQDELFTEDDLNTLLINEQFNDVVATKQITSDSIDGSIVVEFRIWQKGRVNIEALSGRLKSSVSHATWDLVIEKELLVVPLCQPLPDHYIMDEFNLNLNSNASITNFLRNSKGTVQMIAQHQTQSLDGVKKNLQLHKTLSDTEIASTSAAIRTEANYNSYETGDSGMLHETYATIMQAWMQFGVSIKVPSIVTHSVKLTMSHPVDTMLIELQRFIKSHTINITTKPFTQQQIQIITNNCYEIKNIFVPFDPRQYSNNCLLIGRNFDQWKASCDSNTTNADSLEPKSNKVLQKFSPFYDKNDKNIIITRQRLLLVSFNCKTISFFAYNWSKDRLDKLILYGENLGLWLSARVSIYNSVISQKLGIFHNQPVSRKQLTSENPYMPNVTEPEFVARFPSFGSSSHRQKSNDSTDNTSINNMLETFRDANMSIIGHRVIYSSDPIVRCVQELHQLKQYDRKFLEEQKKLHSIWQSRGAITHIVLEAHKIQLLRQQSRVLHYCHTPLLFLSEWRLQSAATRDHSLQPKLPSDSNSDCEQSKSSSHQWHDQLSSQFFQQYNQYLQTLGFIPIQIVGGGSTASGSVSTGAVSQRSRIKQTGSSSSSIESSSTTTVTKTNIGYLQKSMLGGILIFELFFSQPFFITKLYTLECQRIRNKTSRQSMNQFLLSFLDECDRIKVLMHVHSFAYDYHLRCIHSYVSESDNLIGEANLCSGYHLTNFLDDFMRYYSKGPNYARNLVYTEIISIDNLITAPKQLYDYLLSHEKQYHMSVFAMNSDENEALTNISRGDNEYVLVQVSSSPQFTYKDSQDRQHTDDLDITLIISHLDDNLNSASDQTTLYLKYYLILTSRREIYPKAEVERRQGKFRTVTSTSSNAEHGSVGGGYGSTDDIKESTQSPNLLELNTSLAQEMIENNNLTEVGVSNDTADQLNLNEIFSEPILTDSEHDEETNMKTAGRSTLSGSEIRQETINYLGYYSSHEQLMQQLMQKCAEMTRTKIRNMISRGMIHCRTHLLWNKLVSKPEHNHLSYQEFIDLRNLTRLERISDIEPKLELLLARQPLIWFQQLAKVLVAKYTDQHRYFVSSDGNIQHYVILHPRYSGAFMMLSLNLHSAQGELYAAYREPALLEPSDITIEDRKSLITDFINCICYHMWVGLITT